MDLFRVFREAYVLMTNEDVTRLSKQPWQAVATMLWATRMLRGDGTIPFVFVCLGQAFRPIATGAANQIRLRPGLALHYDSGSADIWTGKIKPMLLAGEQAVDFTTNSDASGHSRLDIVAVRAVEAEGDVRPATFKTPGSAPGTGRFQRGTPHRKSWEVEFQVFEGAAAASPRVPLMPPGWLPICVVTRPNGQVDINPGDINDMRPGDILRANGAELSGGGRFTRLLLGGQAYTGESYTGFQRANRAGGFWGEGDLVAVNTVIDESKPGGTWWLDVLKVWSQLAVDEVRTRTSDAVSFRTADGALRAPLMARNAPVAMTVFHIDDPGAAVAAPYNYAQDASMGVTSVSYSSDGGAGADKSVLVTLSAPLQSARGLVIAQAGLNSNDNVAAGHWIGEMRSATQAQLRYVNANGTVVEPPYDYRHSVLIFDPVA